MNHNIINAKSVFGTIYASVTRDNLRMSITAMVVILLFALMPAPAMAAGFQVPFIQDFGCDVVQWLKGPLAILIFIIVCVVTLVFGLITKMDWGKIITACIIFGVILGIGSILANNNYISNIAGMSACLQ